MDRMEIRKASARVANQSERIGTKQNRNAGENERTRTKTD